MNNDPVKDKCLAAYSIFTKDRNLHTINDTSKALTEFQTFISFFLIMLIKNPDAANSFFNEFIIPRTVEDLSNMKSELAKMGL